jgi:hypothetical protein
MAWVSDMAWADGRTVDQSSKYALVGGIVATAFHVLGLVVVLSTIFVDRSQPLNLGQLNDPYSPLREVLTRPESGQISDTAFRKGNTP